MSADTIAAILIFIMGAIGTAFNTWLTSRIRADISDLKLWATTSFVSKDEIDMRVIAVLDRRRYRTDFVTPKAN